MPIARFRCTFIAPANGAPARQCDQEGTHRVQLVLQNADGTLTKRITLGLDRRCPQHQPPFAREYLAHRDVWTMLVTGFVQSALAHGHGEQVPVRTLTTVHYIPEDEAIGTVEVLAPREDGKLEHVGKARLIK